MQICYVYVCVSVFMQVWRVYVSVFTQVWQVHIHYVWVSVC